MATQSFSSTIMISNRLIQIKRLYIILRRQRQPKRLTQMACKSSSLAITKSRSTLVTEPKKSFSQMAQSNVFLPMEKKKASLQMAQFKELIWMEQKPLHIQMDKSKHIYQHRNDTLLIEIY